MPLGAARYKVRRAERGELVDGIYEDDVFREFVIMASIQPVTNEQLLNLEEGLRMLSPVNVHVHKPELLTARTSQMPDEIYYDGDWYQIADVSKHNRNAPLPHSRYTAILPRGVYDDE